ncbi:Uncharacterised protein [Legionella beliardensis]|uniref:Inverse autotransporter beta-domain domain-containing protein n=1 Tax=Legionella beliardensis TaxID=91822 RepID=A0A378I394_9GAMM|nr:hypothetical protein [Legionella beliardensis]STX29230.1 Uncharacterised protein [Legionella beliardensis]
MTHATALTAKTTIIPSTIMAFIFSLYSEVTYSEFITAPWSTRFTGQGLVGDHLVSGFIDGMQPLIGNNNQLWFLDGSVLGGSGDFHKENVVYSLGTGFRQLTHLNQAPVALGGFFFADYQKTANRTQAWLANPGIELLGQYNEARVQGYIPLSHASQPYQNLFASELSQMNVASSPNFNHLNYVQGHSFFDTPVALTDEYGTGVEAELGHYLPWYQGGWLRGGVYYFQFNHAKEITGVEANIELFARKNAALIVQDNYDNQNKNKFSIGIRLSFDGFNYAETQPISERMTAPIIRHLARQYEGLGTPVRKGFKPTSPQVITNNIWFFSPNGTFQGHNAPVNLLNCTAENPCLNLDQTLTNGIATIAPQAQMWFAPGTYILPSTGNNGFIQLADGQTLWGRTSNFINPANFNQLPHIIGGLWWSNNGLINNMQVTNINQVMPTVITGSLFDAAITVGANTNMVINNSVINSLGTQEVNAYASYANNNNLYVNYSILNANSETGLAVGGLNNYEKIFINYSIINIAGSNLEFGNYGVVGQNLSVKHSTINAIGTSETGTYGVAANNNATVTQSIVNVTGTGLIFGVSAINNAHVSNSVINTTADGDVYGLSTGNDALVTSSLITSYARSSGLSHAVDAFNSIITSSQIYAKSASDNEAIGVIDYIGGATINISNSFINAENTQGGLAQGIDTVGGEITFTGGASHVIAQANEPSLALPTRGAVRNRSKPKSLCIANGVITNC